MNSSHPQGVEPSVTAEDIKNGYIERHMPSYATDKEVIIFESNAAFNHWLLNVVSKHGKFGNHGKSKCDSGSQIYRCNHHGKPRTAQNQQEGSPAKRQRHTTKKSIKVGCKAHLIAKPLVTGSIMVTYYWNHNGHDPTSLDEISLSGLDNETRRWIEQQVEQERDWKSIIAILRHEEDELDEMVMKNKIVQIK
jgi:hypothetical protein